MRMRVHLNPNARVLNLTSASGPAASRDPSGSGSVQTPRPCDRLGPQPPIFPQCGEVEKPSAAARRASGDIARCARSTPLRPPGLGVRSAVRYGGARRDPDDIRMTASGRASHRAQSAALLAPPRIAADWRSVW